MRLFASLLLKGLLGWSALLAVPAMAEKLTLERIIASPALSGPQARKVKISPDGARVTFLRARLDDRQQLDLWEFNLNDNTTRLLLDSKRLQPGEQLSAEEQGRRERARSAGLRGIVDYGWSPDGKQILVPLADSLYRIELAHIDTPHKLLDGSVADAKISPMGRYVSFVREQNLFVIDLKTGQQRQLTRDGGGTIHNAEAEFVAQEEMDQHTGYWWAPDDSAIAFKRFDEEPVAVARRLQISARDVDVSLQRYPYAGQANVKVGLGLVSPTGGEPRMVDLGPDPDIYLARVNWRPDSREVWFQRQSRDQKRLDLVAVAMPAQQAKSTPAVPAASLTQRLILSETSPVWVELNDDLHFLEKQPFFVWASERSGRKYLYLYGLDGKLIRPLTAGAWGVDAVLALDEKAGRVLVASNKDAVTDKQVYAVTLKDGTAVAGAVPAATAGADAASTAATTSIIPLPPQRMTHADGWHDAVFAKDGSFFVDTFSAPDTPPQVALKRLDDSRIAWIEANELNAGHPYAAFRDQQASTEYGQLQAADGQVLHYSLMKPPGFDASKRYPVLVQVYGGPGVQTVTRRWHGGSFDEYLAQQGYLVFQLDNRGSSRRERSFTDVIYHNLGQHEIDDQLRGIDWLRQQTFVDGGKVAVFGGSYGGFMTLRLLAAAPDKIAAGVAHAAPVDWALYDTHYTERYLGQPQQETKAYQQSAVLPYLKTLRSSSLLITHGMADDNVLFSNATALMQALNSQATLYELLTYPGERHGIRSPGNQLHWYRSIQDFLARRLKLAAP